MFMARGCMVSLMIIITVSPPPLLSPAPTAEIPNTNTPQACSFPQFPNCQPSTFSIEGPETTTTNINIYNLNTVGASIVVLRDGQEIASAVDNKGVFPGWDRCVEGGLRGRGAKGGGGESVMRVKDEMCGWSVVRGHRFSGKRAGS